MSSLALTIQELSAQNLAKLPPCCYALLNANPPGARIVLISAGVNGASLTTFDDPDEDPNQAMHLVHKLNARLGVSPRHVEAMLAGAIYGWHVSAADPDTYTSH